MNGKLLREVRTTLGLSCEEMASLVGVTLRSYYRHEQDKAPLTVKRLLVILLKNPHLLNAEIAALRRT